MPLLDLFRRRPTKQSEPRAVSADYGVSKMSLTEWLYDMAAAAEDGLGSAPTQKAEIERGHRDWAYSCVQVIVDRISTLGWSIVRGDEPQENHPAAQLLRAPNHLQGGMEFLHSVVAQLLLCGNAYLYAYYGQGGARVPQEILPLSPALMTLTVDEINWRVSYNWNGTTIRQEDLLHLKLPNPASLWVGASPIEAACYAHDISLFSQIYQKNFFRNNARPDFAVILPPAVPANQDAARKVWDLLQDRHAGVANSHRPLVLGNGAAVLPLALGDADRRYLEASNATRDKILSIYRVPAAKIGLVADSNRANADAADYTFNRDTIQPKTRLIADMLSGYLARLFREDIRFEFESPVVEDQVEERAQETYEIEMGLATRNEIRERRGLPPVEGGDVLLLRQGLIPADMAGASIQSAIDMRQALLERPAVEPEPNAGGEGPKPTQPEQPPDENVEAKGAHPRILTFRQLVKAATMGRSIPIEIHAEAWGRYAKRLKPGEANMREKVADFFNREKDLVLSALPAHYEARRKSIDYAKPRPSIEAWLRKDDGEVINWADEAALLGEITGPVMLDSLLREFKLTVLGITESEVPIEQFLPKFNAWLDKRLASYPAQVCEQTRAIADGIIRRALAQGQSIDECAATIQAQFTAMEGWRAQLIARTEINGTMNYGALEGYRESGVVEKKQWLAAIDERTRTWDNGDEFNHAIDEIVPLDAPFMGTGEPLEYPGALGGSPGNICNCRCTTVPVIEE